MSIRDEKIGVLTKENTNLSTKVANLSADLVKMTDHRDDLNTQNEKRKVIISEHEETIRILTSDKNGLTGEHIALKERFAKIEATVIEVMNKAKLMHNYCTEDKELLNGYELIKDTVLRDLNMIDISLDKLDFTLKRTQKELADKIIEYENKIDELTKSYENKL